MDGIKVVVLLLSLSALGASSQKLLECKTHAVYLSVGVDAQHAGFPRDVVWEVKDKLDELKRIAGDWPMDHFYIRDDGETDEQKKAIETAYTEGWDKGQGNPSLNPHSARDAAFEACMNGSDT